MRTLKLVVLVVLICAMPLAAQEKLDVTFFVGGDIHIGDGGRGMTEQIAENHVRALNLLNGGGRRLPWPDKTIGAGQPIPQPEAVFIAGDLMADNSIGSVNEGMLRRFYVGEERLLMPWAYLGAGNHDTWAHIDAYTYNGNTNNNGIHRIARETAKRRLVSTFDPSWPGAVYSSPAHYAVALGNGKLLAVVLSPSIGEPCRAVEGTGLSHGITRGPAEPECNAFAWLRDTLEKHITANGGNRKAPVVIIQHYGYDPDGMAMDATAWSAHWWDPGARELLADIIRKYNVLAVINGHAHVPAYIDPLKTRYKDQPLFSGEVSASAIDVGYPKTRGWADVNGDGYIDYCRIYNGPAGVTATCKLFDGNAFGAEVSSKKIDAGYDESIAWVDVNDDRKADFCRVVNHWDRRARCELSNGSSFDGVLESGPIEAGPDKTPGARFWVDVNNDRRTDFCSVAGDKVRCYLAAHGGFSGAYTGTLDIGWPAGRAFADVDGDGKLDYCRLTGDPDLFARCALFRPTGFVDVFASPKLDQGADDGRAFVDINGDQKADFCRLTDYRTALSSLGAMRCTLSNGQQFTGPELVSPLTFYDKLPGTPVARGIDLGFTQGRAWADVNGDKLPEYCRTIIKNDGTGGRQACSTIGGVTMLTPRLDPGYAEGRTWIDINRDRRADYCRVTGSNAGSGTIRCTLAAALDTGPPVDAFSVASGYCAGDVHGNVGGFTVFRVTDDRFEAVEVTKPPLPVCGSPSYDGSVAAGPVFTKTIVTK